MLYWMPAPQSLTHSARRTATLGCSRGQDVLHVLELQNMRVVLRLPRFNLATEETSWEESPLFELTKERQAQIAGSKVRFLRAYTHRRDIATPAASATPAT